MKKKLLSISLILSFIIYAAYERITGLSALSVAINRESKKNNVPIADSTYIPTTPVIQPHRVPSEDDYEDDDGFFGSLFGKKIPSPTKPPVQTSQPKPATPTPVSQPTPTTPTANPGLYRSGEYIGSVADAYYGNVQVKVVVSGGKIADVQFLNYPQDRNNSIRINTYAMPILTSEAIQAQNANVDAVSGATATSAAFNESLAFALAQAKN